MRLAVALCASLIVGSMAQSWKIIDSDIATVDTGVAFTSDTVGYSAATANGAGPEIVKTTNGGVNWASCPATFGLDLLLLDIDATEDTIVVASIFGELYSTNGGTSFSASTGGGTSQSVRFLGVNGDGGKKFGVTGQYGAVNGVGLSVDGGATFTAYDAKLTTDARYGAFPSDTQWYCAGGTWPDEGNDDDPNNDDPTDDQAKKKVSIPKRLRKSRLQKANGHMMSKMSELNAAPTGSYEAQITKTSDGGATWTTVFNVSNQFYFNSIDCQPSNPDWCCALGEGFQDSTVPGGRIHCTQDGGSTWKRTFWMPGTNTTQYSLMEIRYATDNDVWVAGSELGELYATAWFIYSADGGQTWTPNPTTFTGYSPLGLSFVDPTHAFAALDNTITQEAGIAVYS